MCQDYERPKQTSRRVTKFYKVVSRTSERGLYASLTVPDDLEPQNGHDLGGIMFYRAGRVAEGGNVGLFVYSRFRDALLVAESGGPRCVILEVVVPARSWIVRGTQGLSKFRSARVERLLVKRAVRATRRSPKGGAR